MITWQNGSAGLGRAGASFSCQHDIRRILVAKTVTVTKTKATVIGGSEFTAIKVADDTFDGYDSGGVACFEAAPLLIIEVNGTVILDYFV